MKINRVKRKEPNRKPHPSSSKYHKQFLTSEGKETAMVYANTKIIAAMMALSQVRCFVPVSTTFVKQQAQVSSGSMLAAKRKQSMAQKRKKRVGKTIPQPLERPKVLDTIPKPDEWTKTVSTSDQVKTMKDAEEAKSQASALIETQRKSVDVLTHVRECVESLPYEKIIKTVSEGQAHVQDGFLGLDLSEEIKLEGEFLFSEKKMELDLQAGICSGEYAAAIKGGEDQYSDCPRCVEFVVSLTRHMSAKINDCEEKFSCILDDKASMAGVRTFDRKARLSSLQLLTGGEENDPISDRPFTFVVDKDSEELDLRRISVIYFSTHDNWNMDCGGGITLKDGDDIEAKNDRLVVLSSEECEHKMNEWIGNDDLQSGSYIITHLVKAS